MGSTCWRGLVAVAAAALAFSGASCRDSGNLSGQAHGGGGKSDAATGGVAGLSGGTGGAGPAGGGSGAGTGGIPGNGGGISTGGVTPAGGSSVGVVGSGGATASGGGGGGGGTATCPAVACATRLVCERFEGPVCADPFWAEWPMPNGQSDVTDGAPNLVNYTNNGDGTVSDNVTGLMWQQTTQSAASNYLDAVAYCPGLTLAGYHDWRLPSRIELVSIVDYQRYKPALDPVFAGPVDDYPGYWTPALSQTATSVAIVIFSDGSTIAGSSTDMAHVRCVR